MWNKGYFIENQQGKGLSSLEDADLTEINKTKLLEFLGKNHYVFAKDKVN